MFKDMRRKDKQTSSEEAVDILNKCQYGILSTVGENGYAYGIPLSYVHVDNKIYFHSAKSGNKLDNIKYNEKVSFCVVGETELLPDKFDTKYESVIVFGKAEEVDGDEKYLALMEILKKYSSDFLEKGKKYIENASSQTKVVKINIEHMTGKIGK